MSRSYATSQLAREITKLSQEMVSLKSPQRYLMGQVKGFVSNTIRVNSRIIATRSGYEYRGILGWAKFITDKPEKRVNAKLKFQLYSSTGIPISLDRQGSGVAIEALQSSAGDNPNEMWFLIWFDISGAQGSTDAFYGDFWVVANDSGILTYMSDVEGPSY